METAKAAKVPTLFDSVLHLPLGALRRQMSQVSTCVGVLHQLFTTRALSTNGTENETN